MTIDLKSSAKTILCSVILTFITGCAHMNVTKTRLPKGVDDEETGFRFYRPAPYLLVSAVPPVENKEKEKEDDKLKADDGGEPAGPTYSYSIVWLPDKSQEYRIDFKSGFGTIETNFELENGWNLTSFGQTQDSKVADVITGLATAAATAAAVIKGTSEKSGNTDTPELKLGLYRIMFDDSGMISHFEHIDVKGPLKK